MKVKSKRAAAKKGKAPVHCANCGGAEFIDGSLRSTGLQFATPTGAYGPPPNEIHARKCARCKSIQLFDLC